MNFLTIGADPELFVRRIGTSEIVPVCGLLGGDKKNPLPVRFGAVQEDNVLAEFNIDPCAGATDFSQRLIDVMNQVNMRLFEHGCESTIMSSFEFDMETLRSAGPQAMKFGCDPDLNAWTHTRQNVRPRGGLRTAGGHIHVGNDGTRADNAALIKRMDLYLGIPSVLMDNDTRRRTMYGNAGSFRFKPYGVEYRSLSNFWLSSVEHMRWAYEQTVRSVHDVVEVPSSVKNIVDTGDKDAALALVKEFNLEVL